MENLSNLVSQETLNLCYLLEITQISVTAICFGQKMDSIAALGF